MKEAKENFWKKWRKPFSTGRQNFQKQDETIALIEEKLRKIDEILEDVEKREIERNEKERLKKEKRNEMWREKVQQEALKTRRLEEKQDIKVKKKQLEEKWEMLKWVTTYPEKNQARWEREKEERRMEQEETLAAWEKRGRLDKVRILKEKLTRGE